jgi:hypothetical protein
MEHDMKDYSHLSLYEARLLALYLDLGVDIPVPQVMELTGIRDKSNFYRARKNLYHNGFISSGKKETTLPILDSNTMSPAQKNPVSTLINTNSNTPIGLDRLTDSDSFSREIETTSLEIDRQSYLSRRGEKSACQSLDASITSNEEAKEADRGVPPYTKTDVQVYPDTLGVPPYTSTSDQVYPHTLDICSSVPTDTRPDVQVYPDTPEQIFECTPIHQTNVQVYPHTPPDNLGVPPYTDTNVQVSVDTPDVCSSVPPYTLLDRCEAVDAEEADGDKLVKNSNFQVRRRKQVELAKEAWKEYFPSENALVDARARTWLSITGDSVFHLCAVLEEMSKKTIKSPVTYIDKVLRNKAAKGEFTRPVPLSTAKSACGDAKTGDPFTSDEIRKPTPEELEKMKRFREKYARN